MSSANNPARIRELFPDADPEQPLFAGVQVELTGSDANPVIPMRTTYRALQRAGATPEQLAAFQDEALSGDSDHVLQTCMEWVEVL